MIAWLKHHWFQISFAFILFLAIFLRFYRLDQLPPGLYWEEVALGYDAYSISQTARDHHGQFMPIVAFESFGDYKPALYFYVLVPFVKLLGLSAWAVRLPAALSGLSIVLGVGFLVGFMVQEEAAKQKLQLAAMAVTAVSPWAIQFSRAGWEVNLATALILWGVNLFLSTLTVRNCVQTKRYNTVRNRRIQFATVLISAMLLILSTYTYHAARVIAPLLGLGLAWLWWREKKFEDWWQLGLAAVLSLILISPLLLSLTKVSTTQRLSETSLFSDLTLIEESNLRKKRANQSFISRIVYHRYLLYGREILSNYLDHFNLDFLIISGDQNPRHSVQYFGTFYHFEIILLILGAYALFHDRQPLRWFFAWWLIIGILPAALTKTTPHALRILPTLPVWLMLITLGFKQLRVWLKAPKQLFVIAVMALYLIEVGIFWRFYTKLYPQLYAEHWQVGAKEYVLKLAAHSKADPDQTITAEDKYGRTMMFYWFYNQTEPKKVQAAEDEVRKDQGEFMEFENISLH